MGLILDQKVKVALAGENISHYEKLGYEIPRVYSWGRYSVPRGSFLFVNLDDLPTKSGAIIQYICDSCGETKEINYYTYVNDKKDRPDGKTFCKKCKSGKYVSFYQWMVDAGLNIQDYWGKKNTILPQDIHYGSVKKIWIKCDKKEYHGEYETIPNSFTSGRRCPYCKGVLVHKQDSVGFLYPEILDYWSDRNTVSPFEILPATTKKVWLKCNATNYHSDYLTLVPSFVNGHRCPYCTGKLVDEKDSLLFKFPEVQMSWSDKNGKSPSEYFSYSGDKVWWKCPSGRHEEFERRISESTDAEFRCPICSSLREVSTYQEKTHTYLHQLNFTVYREAECNLKPINPITNSRMYYDNEIESLKLIIEVHGSQHYTYKSLHHFDGTIEEAKLKFENQQWRDAYKKQYAIDNGYNFLELPYWVFDKNDTYKQLIDEKIASIKMEA